MGSLSANFGVRSEAEQARKFRSFSFSAISGNCSEISKYSAQYFYDSSPHFVFSQRSGCVCVGVGVWVYLTVWVCGYLSVCVGVCRVTSFERRTTAYQCDQNENCETSNHFSISGNSYSSPDLLMDAKIAQECEAGFMKVNSGRTKQSPVYRTDASFASIFQPYYITCYYVKHMRRKRKATWKPQQ
ncbi:hypothetical protein T11_18006 [Trichinella zimbabwensis]|uniref:Uncharacterized protein n=1 Tax=Trichinella zimbabwensis TaxID=268475 RepID=A0A0V1HYD7_9BILA|nr:hypothetical protein T11_18006 [Trichinella zimbabwensis]